MYQFVPICIYLREGGSGTDGKESVFVCECVGGMLMLCVTLLLPSSPGGWPGKWCARLTLLPVGTLACLWWLSQTWLSAWPGSH